MLEPVSANDSPYCQDEAPREIAVTPFLIVINVLVYLVMVLSGVPFLFSNGPQLVPWGANFGPLTMSGQWWRLLTACFLHFGLIHLAGNMLVLFWVGNFSERAFGNARFLLIYLLGGIGGSLASVYFHPLTVGAGASG